MRLLTTIGLAGALAACSGGGDPPACAGAAGPGVCVGAVRGRITDLSGQAAGGVNVTLCGAARCYGGHVDAEGAFEVRVDGTIDPAAFRLHVDGRPSFADRLVPVAGLAPPDLSLAEPIRLPRLPDTGPTMSPDGPLVLVSAGVSVRVPADAHLDFGFSNASDKTYGKTFRAVTVAGDAYADWGPLAEVVAFGPFGTAASRPLGLAIQGAGGLPAGAAVELLVLEDRYEQPALGQMQVAAHGHVSADGVRIETDADEGIQRLTWLGVRAAP